MVVSTGPENRPHIATLTYQCNNCAMVAWFENRPPLSTKYFTITGNACLLLYTRSMSMYKWLRIASNRWSTAFSVCRSESWMRSIPAISGVKRSSSEFLVTIVFMQRKSQSKLASNPALFHLSKRCCISVRTAGQCAPMRARAKSPFDSFVPPELTLLNISTTMSVVLSPPVIC